MSPLALMLLSLLMVILNLNCHAAASKKSLGSEGGGDKQRQAVWSRLWKCFLYEENPRLERYIVEQKSSLSEVG